MDNCKEKNNVKSAENMNFLSKLTGINMDRMFCTPVSSEVNEYRCGQVFESDFKLVSELGFNFVRLPISYRLFTTPEHPFTFDEDKLKKLDEAVEFADRYNIHLNINLHRVPGYCINSDDVDDPFKLGIDEDAEKFFTEMWRVLTARYRGIPNRKVSFNLLNEGAEPKMHREDYIRVMHNVAAAVHEIDEDRFCILDGWACGDEFVPELADVPNSGQACRGYFPRELTHYTRFWCCQTKPAWPLTGEWPGQEGWLWNREKLYEIYSAWADFSRKEQIPIHCSELGCIDLTSASVFYSWLEDLLSVLNELKIGFAFWDVSGEFGIMNVKRAGVSETIRIGDYILDATLIKILQKHLQ